MATTATPNQPRRRSQQPRASVPAREIDDGHEAEYDLLTAALIGVTLGAGLTYMLRRGPSGNRPVSPVMRGVSRGARWAGQGASRLGSAGARWAAHRGEDLWDAIPREEIIFPKSSAATASAARAPNTSPMMRSIGLVGVARRASV